MTNGPMPQWTNGPMDQWTNGLVDQWTNAPMHQSTNWPMDQWANGPMPKQLWVLQLNMKEKTWECLWVAVLILFLSRQPDKKTWLKAEQIQLVSQVDKVINLHTAIYIERRRIQNQYFDEENLRNTQRRLFLLVVTFALLWHGLSQFSECPVWCIWKYSWTLTF